MCVLCAAPTASERLGGNCSRSRTRLSFGQGSGSVRGYLSAARAAMRSGYPDLDRHVYDESFLVDTGAHFKAVQSILSNRFPNVPLAGLFLARRAPEASPI